MGYEKHEEIDSRKETIRSPEDSLCRATFPEIMDRERSLQIPCPMEREDDRTVYAFNKEECAVLSGIFMYEHIASEHQARGNEEEEKRYAELSNALLDFFFAKLRMTTRNTDDKLSVSADGRLVKASEPEEENHGTQALRRETFTLDGQSRAAMARALYPDLDEAIEAGMPAGGEVQEESFEGERMLTAVIAYYHEQSERALRIFQETIRENLGEKEYFDKRKYQAAYFSTCREDENWKTHALYNRLETEGHGLRAALANFSGAAEKNKQ